MTYKEKISRYLSEQLTVKDPQLIEELYNEFLMEFHEKLNETENALAHSDYLKLKTLAHTMKGDSAIIGLEELKIIAMQLQEAAEQKNPEQCKLQIDQMKAELSSCK